MSPFIQFFWHLKRYMAQYNMRAENVEVIFRFRDEHSMHHFKDCIRHSMKPMDLGMNFSEPKPQIDNMQIFGIPASFQVKLPCPSR